MESKTVTVPNIGCNGCVNTIKSELSALDGVQSVEGSVDAKTITVKFDAPASWQKIVEVMTEIDYAPAEA